MLRKKYELFGVLIISLLFCWLWNTIPKPLIGHIESIYLIKHYHQTQYKGKFNPKDFEGKSLLLLVGCSTPEIFDFMSSQNDIPGMQNCVYIFMIPHQEADSIENTPSCRKDVYIDDSLNDVQLARQFYIHYCDYKNEQEPNHKMVFFIDKSGEFIDGYQFNRPNYNNQGIKLNTVVRGWSYKQFTCNDYDLQSILFWLSNKIDE